MISVYLVCLAIGGVLVGLSALGGLGKDLDKGDGHVAEPTAGDIGVAGPGRTDGQRPRTRRSWSPLRSLRFWTFGACFFGLTGTALSQFSPWSEASIALASGGLGLAAGLSASLLIHRLRNPVGAVAPVESLIGQVGELLFPLAPGETSKIRVKAPGQPSRELLATLSSRDSGALPTETRVVVLSVRDGRALVEAAAPEMLPLLEALPERTPERQP